MARRGYPRIVAILTIALMLHVASAGPVAAGPEAGPTGPQVRWQQLLDAHPDLMGAAIEAEAMRTAGERRVSDAQQDHQWIRDGLNASQVVLEEAAADLERAASWEVTAAARLSGARRELDRYRLRMDGHAATIYKHGPPALGPIESLLRSDSPSDFVIRHRMSEAVLIEDDASVRRAASALARAGATHDRAVARRAAARAAWETAREDVEGLGELVSLQEGHVRSARGSLAVLDHQVAGARFAEQQSVAAMIALEEQVAVEAPDRSQQMSDRRARTIADTAAELRERYPYLGRSRSPRPSEMPPIGGYRCPVEGGRFINDWAFPRPGGRSHEGTDVFADRNTPLVAVAAGQVTAVDRHDHHDAGELGGDLGGRTVTLVTPSGERWYYAHLETLTDGIEVGVTVSAGQQLGTVGDSGNARGGAPHLHLGRYWQDEAINPYPSLELACG